MLYSGCVLIKFVELKSSICILIAILIIAVMNVVTGEENNKCSEKYSIKNSIAVEIPVREASGLAVDDRSGLLYVHEDSNNKNNVYVLDENGKLKNIIVIEGLKNNDWEDITTDNKGKFWLIDSRESIIEFQADIEGKLIKDSIKKYNLPEQLKGKNVESIDYVADENKLIAIYKGHENRIYKFKPGDKSAEYAGKIPASLKMLPSGMTHHPQTGNYFVVAFWGHKIVEFKKDFKTVVCVYALPTGKMISFQAEGIAFDKDLNLLLTCEKPWYSLKGKSRLIKLLNLKKD